METLDEIARLTNALAGRYTVEREIGRGGMAVVYRARDERHRRWVALKVVRPELGAVLGAERFLAEIQVTANLQHPNLLPLFDSGEADGLLFYVMPFVDGESLRAKLEREKQLPIDEAVRFATTVAGALDYAHRHGVIHRDLKPENILLDDGQPVVTDFGIALAVTRAGGARVTQTGLSLGTPQYMSPEQAAGDRHLDGRSDVYSLGTLLYEMLTGEPPHIGTTAQAVIAKVLTDKPVSVRYRRDTVPVNVDVAINRALAKLPADRFATAHEFADALTRVEENLDATVVRARGAAQIPNVERDIGAVVPRKPWWRQPAVWITPVLAAVSVGVTWALMRTNSGSNPPSRFELTFADGVSLAGNVSGPVLDLSPDGRQIAFVGVAGARRQIYVRRLDDLTAHPIEGTDDAIRPAFSPDGRWVAYEHGPRGTLKKAPVTGGQATTIASTGVGTFDWAEDGTIVFERSNGLWRVSSAGGEPALLAMPDTARGERFLWPRTLPGSQTVVCNLVTASGGLGSIIGNPEVVAIGSDGSVTKLGIVGTNPRYVATGHLLVARSDGVVLAAPFDVRRGRVIAPPVPVLEQIVRKGGGATEMAVSRNGTLVYVSGPPARQVVLLDRAARATVLLQGTDRYSHPRFSPDGKHLTLQTGDIDQGDVWILDVNTRTMSRVSQDGRSAFPEWTPDGRHIVFWSGNSMRAALVRVTWDGSGVADTIAVGLQAGEMSIATASNRLVLQTTRVGTDLYAGFLDSMRALRPWLATSALEENPRLSPDGKWVAYVSHETGRNDIYVRSFAGSGGRYQLSTVGGNAPRWSSDGHTVFYRVSANMSAGVGSHLIAATLRLTPAVTVVRRDTMFIDNAANISTVYGFDYDVAPDGQHFAITSSLEAMSRPVVVFNWFNELRNRMAPVAKK